MSQDEIYMSQALLLAKRGKGKVSPNPMVGCVIVYNGKVIGEGCHKEYGGLHAEPNAVNSVADKKLISESTVYVTLEPCAHYGKTPPCAMLLADLKPKRIVIANQDPNPLVAGKGVQILEDVGIEVVLGVLEEEVAFMNRRFLTYMQKKRPYVILKWAETQDGFVARKNFDSKWISNASSRKLVHQLRADEDAIMVGYNTALHDNPKLNVRDVEGKDPLRIVIDKRLNLPLDYHFFDKTQKTIVYNKVKNTIDDNIIYVKLEGDDFIEAVLIDLYKRNKTSLIVEGGSTLLKSFIEKGLWDEVRVFIGNQKFEEGIVAPHLNVDFKSEEDIDGDKLKTYYA